MSSFLFAVGQTSGDGGTHKPSGQWNTAYFASSSMLVPDGHDDDDEATERFRRVRVALVVL